MAKELTVISKSDVEKVWKLRGELAQRTHEYNKAEYAFISAMYAFSEKYRNSEEALNAELNRRSISTRDTENAYFIKVAKLALAQKSIDGKSGDEEWILEPTLAPEVSRYAVIMAGADKTGIPAAEINQKLLALGKSRMISEMRKALGGKGDDGGERNYLSYLSESISDGAGDLVSRTYKVDREKLGLPVGKIELVGELSDAGELRIRAIFPAEKDLDDRLEKVYGKRKPLDRGHGELFLEILKLSGVLPDDANASIKNDGSGVVASIVVDDEEGRTYAAQIKSSRYDPSYGADLDCCVSVGDIKKWAKLSAVYGEYVASKIASKDGKLVVEVTPKGVPSLDKAVETENGGKDVSKAKAHPTWVIDAELIKNQDGERRRAIFEKPNVPKVAANLKANAVSVLLPKDKVSEAAQSARASKGQAVQVVKDTLAFGKAGSHVDTILLARALTRIKVFAEDAVEVSVSAEGALVETKNRDYVWSVFLPTIK